MPTGRAMDLTTISGVQAYLARKTSFTSHTITQLTGGSVNFTYRIHLVTPFDGKTTLVVKHAQPYVKNLPGVVFGLERQIFEVEALRRVKAWLPVDSVVTVPTIYMFDRERGVIIMEDCGEDCLTLKELLRQGKGSSATLAEDIGFGLGEFVGCLHQWGRENPAGLLDFFGKNQQAKKMSAWVIYGRLISTLSGESALPALSDPPIDISEESLEVISKVVDNMSHSINDAQEYFVMGDFWPGNMMVALDGGKLRNIYILDWELAKPGLPGVEIGQFCAEIHLLRRFDPFARAPASRILETFCEAYAYYGMPDVQVVRDALVQLGSHLVVSTPRIPWGDKESTRKVVQEGVHLLVGASSRDEDWLRHSIIGGLVSRV